MPATASKPPPADRDAEATEGEDGEDLEQPPRKAGGRGTGGGRVKAQARARMPTSKYRPASPPPARTKRPASVSGTGQPTARVIVKRRKASRGSAAARDSEADVVMEVHSLPVSEVTNRVMLGQMHLNKLFPKNYIARSPVKRSPIRNLTLSSAFHMVSDRCYILLHIVL